LNDAARPAPAVVKVAAADAARKRAAEAIAKAPAPAPVQTAAAPAPAAPVAQPQTVALASTAAGGVAGIWGASTQNVKKWLHVGGQDPAQPEVTAYVPDQPIPTDVPLPPRRDPSLGQSEKPLHVALKSPAPPVRPATSEAAPAKPDETAAPAAAPAATAPAAAQ